MEGRRQKAREGKWNGGFAPYGYKLENGKLLIAEDEAEVIRIIYDKYVNTTMGKEVEEMSLDNETTVETYFITSLLSGVVKNKSLS
ncbi:hypothetical protein NXH76_26850 [Blautia schinkii]|nr:hypothetical protein [Blautia schinkii]